MGRVREVLNADCLEAMRSMEDCTFDAVVTDPPYGLSFMGAEWDSFGTDTRQPGDEHYCGIARRRIEDALPHQQRLF